MKKKKDAMLKITRPILWASADGMYVVVQGPFPEGFTRCLTSKSVREAAKRNPVDPDYGMVARPGTTREDYAKTLRALVIDNKNDWGEVAP